ncbi:MAG: PilZ domain-containing protein [Desulfobacca sp.]|nr:PilZ domain-containing protein [Desulfobacca sp.]
MQLANQLNPKLYPFQGQEGRRSYRVPCRLPVYYRLLPPLTSPNLLQAEATHPPTETTPRQSVIFGWTLDHLFNNFCLSEQTQAGRDEPEELDLSTKRTEHKVYLGETLDLSVDGLRLYGATSLPAGQELELAILLPSRPCQVQKIFGRVVWTDQEDERQVGIGFVNMTKADREHLFSFVFYWQRQLLRGKIFNI